MIQICPSILNVDRSNLISEIGKVSQNSDLLHLDVMDNIFVPNFTFDIAESEKIIKDSPLPADVHLMINDPDTEAIKYASFGAANVTFHLEASQTPFQTIGQIQNLGARAALAIKPKTEFEVLLPFLETVDMILIMTVEPGFGGQSFMSDMLKKVGSLRKELDQRQLSKVWLQVDGGISLETIAEAADAGADTFVAGSAVFNSSDPSSMCAQLRALASANYQRTND